MIEVIVIILLIFGGCTASFFAGYKFSKKEKDVYHYYSTNSKPGPIDGPPEEVTLVDKQKEIVRELVDKPSFDEPSGPVYRPSSAELVKMNESQTTREAKAAVAETFKNEPEVNI